jgi:hypothetical protein
MHAIFNPYMSELLYLVITFLFLFILNSLGTFAEKVEPRLKYFWVHRFMPIKNQKQEFSTICLQHIKEILKVNNLKSE